MKLLARHESNHTSVETKENDRRGNAASNVGTQKFGSHTPTDVSSFTFNCCIVASKTLYLCEPKFLVFSPRTRSLAVDADPTLQAAGSGGGLGLDGALDTLTYGLDTLGNATGAAGTFGTTGVTTVATAGSTSASTTTQAATTNRLSPSTATTSTIPQVQGSSPGGKPLGTPKLTSLPQRPSSSKKPQEKQCDPNAPPPDYNSIVEKAGLPAPEYQGITNVSSVPGSELKVKRRNMGLGMRPRIIIFSDKKDLIRVSLDTEDESDNDVCKLSFKKPSSKYLGIKSARRRSIAGESFALSSSMESLSDDTKHAKEASEAASKDNLILIGYDDIPGIDGAINYAFDPEEFAAIESAEQGAAASAEPKKDDANSRQLKLNPTKGESSKSESQTDEEQPSEKSKLARPKSAKPKSGGKIRDSGSPKRVKVTAKDSILEQEESETAVPSRPSSKEAFEKSEKHAVSKEKSARTGRSKSAKNGHNKVEPRSKPDEASGGGSSSKGKGKASRRKGKKEDDDEEEGSCSSSPSRNRPLTALDRWNNKEVENMSKIVAWDRPEDDI